MEHDAEISGYLFEQARDIILVIDAEDGAIIDANLAAEQAYGYPRHELFGLKIFDLRTEALGPVSEQMRMARERGLLFETKHRRKDGTAFPVEVSSRGEVMGGRACLFSIIRDITERKHLEEERAELLATTQRALSLRDEFLMIASHELRAPVTNISLRLQQLQRLIDRGATRAHLRVVGEAVFKESERLTALISTLLDAQAAKGQLPLELTDVDLSELVRDVTERLRVRADQVGSEIVVDVPSLHGTWDRLRIDQVVTNLVLNALKYGRGRPVRIVGRAAGANALLEVKDEGIGIGRDDAKRIFGKFERAVPSHYGGLGLGLFIARQIVEAHEGRFDVESVPELGSTFRVMLPRSDATTGTG